MDTISQAESGTTVLAFDVAIVGGGMVGMALACALSKNPDISVVILESNPDMPPFTQQYHHRVSAIALSSVNIFQALQVWDAIKLKRVSPFTAIQVWDRNNKTDMYFECNEIAEPVLGYIVENNVMQNVLRERIKSLPQVQLVTPVKLTSFTEEAEYACLKADDGREYRAQLVVAADGALSWLRNQADINVDSRNYDQEAIVATVETELPHAKIARQVFLPSGPLAFLPLNEPHTSSIVWSLPVDEAARLAALPEEDFKSALEIAFSARLGSIRSIGKRFTFPLKKQQAENYVRGRIALVGDAAHVMHPLAGQGVNIGLLDAASLAEVILDHPGLTDRTAMLRRYERWRRADNLALLTGVDLIKYLFASENISIQAMRAAGLAITSRVRILKNIFTRYAVGSRAGLPILAKTPTHG